MADKKNAVKKKAVKKTTLKKNEKVKLDMTFDEAISIALKTPVKKKAK